MVTIKRGQREMVVSRNTYEKEFKKKVLQNAKRRIRCRTF